MILIPFPDLQRTPRELKWQLLSNTQGFNGSPEQVSELAGARWAAQFEYNLNLMSRHDARKLKAFLTKLRGRAGRFTLHNMARPEPRGDGRFYANSQNLVQRSEQLEFSYWGKSLATVTANAVTAPDGTLSADKVIATATTNNHYIDTGSNLTGLPDNTLYSFSIFIKKAEFARVLVSYVPKTGGSGFNAEFRFDDKRFTQTIGQAGAVLFDYDELPDGWFRIKCKGVSTLTGGTVPRPRIFLSEDIGIAAAMWSKAQAAATANAIASPVAGWLADALIEDGTTNQHNCATTLNLRAGKVTTIEAYFKALGVGATRFVGVSFFNAAAFNNLAQTVVLNLATGALAGISGSAISWSATDQGGGWWKLQGIATPLTTGTASWRISITNSATVSNATYLGDTISGFYCAAPYAFEQLLDKTSGVFNSSPAASVVGDAVKGAYMWGAQYELGSQVTSYVPTTTAAITNRLGPYVYGAGQTGNSLVVWGWQESITGILKAGDFFSVNGELKMVTADANTDALGRTTLQFEPPLRSAPADLAQVTVDQPTGTFMLTEDIVQWSTNGPGLVNIPISCIEAI
jgi:hypothetical protein